MFNFEAKNQPYIYLPNIGIIGIKQFVYKNKCPDFVSGQNFVNFF